jgi:NTE family protein
LTRRPARAAVAAKPVDEHRIGLALGGGGARGLAHITVLEAFDDLGLVPCAISGTSIGAMVGSAYAAGIPARDLREHVHDVLRSRTRVVRRIFGERPGTLFDLIDFSPFSSALLDGERLLKIFMPLAVPETFSELRIPFVAVATDFYDRSPVVLADGPLRRAVAASIALPGLISPQTIDGRLLIDGGMVNPLPFDQLQGKADFTVAVDVIGGNPRQGNRRPSRIELIYRSSQIMQYQIVKMQLREHPVDILIVPDVDRYRVLEFFKARAIMESGESARDELKHRLDALITGGWRRTP